MSSWEKPIMRPHQRRKTPSFSSSLLEAIYHSIDESKEEQHNHHVPSKRNNGFEPEEEIASVRRAILIEKWMESYKYTQSSGHFSSDSTSSTDSSMFSSSETDSASRSTPKSTKGRSQKVVTFSETTPKCDGGRFMRTKSRALKIYGDLKKAKQPISPGGKIANFLNSIFNSKKNQDHWSSVRKSRSVNDSVTTTTTTTSPCLNKTPSNKSKRSVRFCPVSVILDEESQPCGHKSIYKNEEPRSRPCINSYRGYCDDEEDGRSCASSDLFELENIGMIATRDELPVYGTTSFKMNQAIARRAGHYAM